MRAARTTEKAETSQPFGRVARLLISPAEPLQWVPHPSRAFREGWAAVRSHHGASLDAARVPNKRIGSIATRPCKERKNGALLAV